jgi:lycopene cyclase CruP
MHMSTMCVSDLQDVATGHYDVVVLGGTLGMLLATALLAQQQQQQPGAAPLRVAVVERGKLQGRQQEWNVSASDLQVRPLLLLWLQAVLDGSGNCDCGA